ncbi:hypothetical protein TELCIR_08899 [Teladorsagia circumcincta]|uniref:CHK kinase-like domain-containing protein n=1 Tax=Teladorsagia circumcincta TaxID=45464 RepID=A0A2G9UGB6_TELCI|nr:hypothetical protein TELCIR_08899 [Teladorsagia circumcincta]
MQKRKHDYNKMLVNVECLESQKCDRICYKAPPTSNGFIHYRVFFVENVEEEETMTLSDASKLVVFVVRIDKGRQRHHLSENELYLVAEKLGAVHAINTESMAPEFLRVIGENHENIRRYQASLEPQLIAILKDALKGELSQYFCFPNEVIPRLETVLRHDDECPEPSERVVCHGNLSAENCHFKETPQHTGTGGHHQSELVDISEWENVHFGDVALDLSNLIISSAEPIVRRNKYMSIFRRYYYSRVDYRPTNFRLADLKRLFRKHHKRAVLLGIEPLLEILTSSADDEVKRAHSYRWESALEDAFDFTSTGYVSDDEHCLFTK